MNFRRLASSLLVAAGMLCSVTIADAQTVANGPYYATPSWDQTMPASTRFIVLSNMNNEAVLDRETGLVWTRSVVTFDNYLFVTQRICASLIQGGRRGWRLPTASEMISLFDPAVTAPPNLPVGHPFQNFPNQIRFWTSTHQLDGSDSLYFRVDAFVGTNFYSLGVSPTRATESGDGICVRGAE